MHIYFNHSLSMNASSLKNTVKRFRFFLFFLIVIGLSLGVWSLFVPNDNYIPQSFIDARRASAIVGDQIIGLSSESSAGIGEIQKLQEDKKYNEALDAIVAERKRVADMRDKGSELLKNLSAMTQSVSLIRPEASRAAALQAINYETGIVNHLISYNEDLDQLLQLIAAKVLYGEDIADRFNDLIVKINGEIETINDLNKKFTEAMEAIEKGSL